MRLWQTSIACRVTTGFWSITKRARFAHGAAVRSEHGLSSHDVEHDDFDEYLSMIGPKIGASFVSIARALITSDIRAKLVALKDFEYTDPGMGYPAWKLAAVNRCKDRMIADILA